MKLLPLLYRLGLRSPQPLPRPALVLAEGRVATPADGPPVNAELHDVAPPDAVDEAAPEVAPVEECSPTQAANGTCPPRPRPTPVPGPGRKESR